MHYQKMLSDAERETLVEVLRRKFRNRPELDVEDAVSTAELAYIEKGVEAKYPAAWIRTTATRKCLDLLGKKDERTNAADQERLSDDQQPASAECITERSERRTLQSDAFYQTLKLFVRECELENKLSRKEVFERRFQRFSSTEIAAEMAKSVRQIDRYVVEAYSRVRDLVEDIDPNYSLFCSLVNGSNRMTTSDAVESPADALLRVLDSTDALCPSEERLRLYRANGEKSEFGDLRFHIEERACGFCKANLQKMGSKSA